MTKQELTGQRSLDFSKWIRKNLPDSDTGYRVTDVDFVLFNESTKRIAILEEKTKGQEVPQWQKSFYEMLGRWIKRGKDPDWEFLGCHTITFFGGTTFSNSERVTLNGKEISEDEAIKFLSFIRTQVDGPNEVDVCYLDDKGQFKSRKTVRYNTYEEAVKVFDNTIVKFKQTGVQALVTIRTLNGNAWSLAKTAERT